MDSKKNQATAKAIFGRHSGKDLIFFSSDGQAFFEKNHLDNHVKTLEDKDTEAITRSSLKGVMPSSEEVVHLEAKTDEETADAVKAKYLELFGVEPDADKDLFTLADEILNKQKADKAAAEAEKKAAADKVKADKAAAEAEKKAAADKVKADKAAEAAEKKAAADKAKADKAAAGKKAKAEAPKA